MSGRVISVSPNRLRRDIPSFVQVAPSRLGPPQSKGREGEGVYDLLSGDGVFYPWTSAPQLRSLDCRADTEAPGAKVLALD